MNSHPTQKDPASRGSAADRDSSGSPHGPLKERNVQGTVKWFNNAKGYGFIARPGKEDVFVHFSEIKGEGFRSLEEGQDVTFDIVQAKNGSMAVGIIKGRAEEPEEPQEPTSGEADAGLVALALIGDKLRLVSLAPDGSYSFLDPNENLHSILYVAGPATLELQNVISQFEGLVNNARAKEVDFQRFFEDHPDFILTEEHKRAHPHLVLESDTDARGALIPDFVLEPVEQSGFADLLELKLPSAPVLAVKQSRLRYSAAVMEACAQLREYSAFFDNPRNRTIVREKYGLIAYRPRLFVIIGRRAIADPLEVRRATDDLPGRIAIRTYDEVLERMRLRLAKMKGGLTRG